jgi:hypothetical protein
MAQQNQVSARLIGVQPELLQRLPEPLVLDLREILFHFCLSNFIRFRILMKQNKNLSFVMLDT